MLMCKQCLTSVTIFRSLVWFLKTSSSHLEHGARKLGEEKKKKKKGKERFRHTDQSLRQGRCPGTLYKQDEQCCLV